jgi:quercetin dioxygenase-like cupin family protein
VQEGEFIYRWIDTETAEVIEQLLIKGDSVRQYPGQPHQLEAVSDGTIYEVSTTHYNTDSYRVWRGDSQQK